MMYLFLVGLLEVLSLRFPVKETFKSSVKTVEKPVKKVSVDSFAVKLGCLSDTEDAVYRQGKFRKKRFYHLNPLTIQRPDWGVTEEKILCSTCGRILYVTVYSRTAIRLKRLSALGFSLLPLTIPAIAFLLNIAKNDFLKGFGIVIFLALVWMIPVFLPVIFRKEYKLALHLQAEKGDRKHRFYETNVESVTQETYYK